MRQWAGLIAAGIGCLFLSSTTCYAETLYACTNNSAGTIRIVSAATVCTDTEVKVSWPNTAETDALGNRATSVESQATSEADGIPTVAPAGYVQPEEISIAAVAPAINPEWNYLTFGYDAFHALSHDATLTIDGNGLHASTSTIVRVPLQLPQGAVVKEVTFWVYNASASTGLSVGLAEITPPNATGGGNFAFTNPGQGSHTVTLTGTFVGNPVDNTLRSYALSAFLMGGGTHGLFGARVAYQSGLLFTPVSPQVRKLDTRKPGPFTGKIASGVTLTPVDLTPQMPAGAKAAVLNVTILQTEGAGYVSVFPAGAARPGTPRIYWAAPGLSVANSATVAVSTAGAISIRCGGRRDAKAHVIVDLVGYYF